MKNGAKSASKMPYTYAMEASSLIVLAYGILKQSGLSTKCQSREEYFT